MKNYIVNVKSFKKFQKKCFDAGVFWNTGAEKVYRTQKDMIEYISIHKEFNRFVIAYDEASEGNITESDFMKLDLKEMIVQDGNS